MSIPNALPTLSAGAHKPGEGKACVMEYVSLLAGEKWSDTPECTYRPLAEAAQVVNDHLSDDDRHLLVPLIGRLFGTALPVDDRLFALRVARTVEHLSTKAKVCNDVTERYLAGTADIEELLSVIRVQGLPANALYDATAYAAKAALSAANAANAANAKAVLSAANAATAYADLSAAKAALSTANAANAANANAASCAASAAIASDPVAWLSSVIDIYDELSGRTEHRDVSDSELAALTLAVHQ